jgi:hypothetical protein
VVVRFGAKKGSIPMSGGGCGTCEALHAAPVLCGAGRSLVYGASAQECSLFQADALAFDALIQSWTTPPSTNASSTDPDPYPGCRDALEVFFCAQQQVFTADEENPALKGSAPSSCSSYRRDYQTSCRSFCPPIRAACPAAALAHCEERCRTTADEAYCPIIEVTGLDTARWTQDTLDIINLYRLEAEADVPLLRAGRPLYRSIPARRPAGTGRATKLDYYLYATRIRGFEEWLLDQNDIDADGAVAYVSDSNFAPYRINSDWSIWSDSHNEWTTEKVRIRCYDGGSRSAAVGRRAQIARAALWPAPAAWLGLALGTVAAAQMLR